MRISLVVFLCLAASCVPVRLSTPAASPSPTTQAEPTLASLPRDAVLLDVQGPPGMVDLAMAMALAKKLLARAR